MQFHWSQKVVIVSIDHACTYIHNVHRGMTCFNCIFNEKDQVIPWNMCQVSWLMISFWTRQIKNETNSTISCNNCEITHSCIYRFMHRSNNFVWCGLNVHVASFLVTSTWIFLLFVCFKSITDQPTKMPFLQNSMGILCLKNSWGIKQLQQIFFLQYLESCVLHVQCYCRYPCILISTSVLCRWRTEKYVLFKTLNQLWV